MKTLLNSCIEDDSAVFQTNNELEPSTGESPLWPCLPWMAGEARIMECLNLSLALEGRLVPYNCTLKLHAVRDLMVVYYCFVGYSCFYVYCPSS